jgi:hypothetical protein
VHRWRARLRTVGTLEDRTPGGVALHALTPFEIDAVLAIAEQWGEVDRSHRKLAHRGSYVEQVWVSPSTFRRVLAAHGLVLPEPVVRDPTPKPGWPDWLKWAPNRIWCWDVTHFPRARRVAFAIIDVVSRRWIETLVSIEETSTQVQVLFDQALIAERLADLITPERLDLPVDDQTRPILLACSDNGPQMTSQATREFLAGLATAQRLARTPRRTRRGSRASSGTSRLSGRTLNSSSTRPCSTPSSTGSAASTTPPGCTPASATSPPTTNTTGAARPSAKHGSRASGEPTISVSPTIAGTATTTPEHRHDLDHFSAKLRG